jgi:putative ABC transport system permease protein
MFDSIWRDVQYAIRGLKSKPGFTIAVVATLGLGIGANAAMFGIVDRLLFRPPPMLKDPETAHRIYLFQQFRGRERGAGGQYARYADLRRWTTSYAAVAGHSARDMAIGVGDEAREMRVGVVSANFFGMFNAPPVRGRYFTEAEDTPPAGANVVVLSNAMWMARYGERDVLGESLQIGPTIYTIIGVAPRGFVGLWPDRPPVAYVSLASYGASQNLTWLRNGRNWWETYSWGWMQVVARRKPGVSIETANADLTQAFAKSLDAHRAEQPTQPSNEILKPRGLAGSIIVDRGPSRTPVSKVATYVGGVSLIVLLIACANVANLLLARALRRRREIALRLALGMGRARLVGQLMTESLILALCGGVAGIVIAHWGGTTVRTLFTDRSEAPVGLGDLRTVLYAAIAAILVGLITGLAPVLQASRADLTGDLKAGSREGTHGRSRLRTALLVFQGALSVVLLVGAGLFVRSLQNVQGMRWGYDVDPILMVTPTIRGVTLDSARSVELYARLLATAKTIPGVENAALQDAVPYWNTSSTSLYVEGIDTVSRLGQFSFNKVSPEFFATMGTRILRGRGITADDRAGTQRVMVTSENMAKTLWPGRDAIGQCIKVASDTMPCTYVVGIAENIKAGNLAEDLGLYYYVPNTQMVRTSGLFIRTRGKATAFQEVVRRRLQPEMPGMSYIVVTPFNDIIGPQKRSWNLGATMFSAFGALALLLSAIGLYSVIAYNVTQRMHEMGVRRALGAQAGDVVRLVVGGGVRIAAVGVVIGVGISLWAVRFLEPLLFRVPARDPLIFATVTLTLLAVAVAASWVPARRASAVDPNVALRSD